MKILSRGGGMLTKQLTSSEPVVLTTAHVISPVDAHKKKVAARSSIIVASFLIALKIVAGWLTGSLSIWASLLDSVLDVFASGLNFIALRAASRPADSDHAYGHGKAESLTGLFQAMVIAVSGVFVISEATRRIFQPQDTRSPIIGIGTMIIAIVVSAWLVRRLERAAKETDSPALYSDSLHYKSDIYTNGSVLIALLIIALTGWRLADPLISIGIALYILKAAVGLLLDSINGLMDKRLPSEVDERVAEIVARYRNDGVYGFHELKTRRSGSQRFIDLHLEIDRNKCFQEAHDIGVKVLRVIEAEIPRSKVHIHTDPTG